MAGISEAESKTLLQAWARLGFGDYLANQAGSLTTPLDTLLDGVADAALGSYGPDITGAVRAYRRNIKAGREAIASILDPIARGWLEALDVPTDGLDTSQLMALLRQELTDSSDSIERRVVTFGTPAAGGGNTGTGVMRRVTVDKDGDQLEGGAFAETVNFEVIEDARGTAQEHEEEFRVWGEAADPNGVLVEGSGVAGSFKAYSGATSVRDTPQLKDPSFDAWTDTATLTNWTKNSGTIEQDTSVYFRGYQGATPSSCKFVDSGSSSDADISQVLTLPAGLRSDVPYCHALAYKMGNAAMDGTLTLHIGAQSVSVDLTTIANTNWNRLEIDLSGSNGTKAWLANFNEANLDVRIVLSGNTTQHDLNIDDFLLVPMVPVLGSYVAILGGATPFLGRTSSAPDSFSYSDSITTTGIISTVLAQFNGERLPSVASGQTINDPSSP